MPHDTPISLVAALIAAALGVAVFVYAFIRLTLELRRKRRLLENFPELDEFEGDVRRYVRRVYLLRTDWRDSLDEATRERVDTLYDEMLTRARRVRDNRAAGNDVTDEIGALIELEDELDRTIEG